MLRNYLRFIDEPEDGDDTNRRRWPTKPYWEDFLTGARRIQIYSKPGVEYNRMNMDAYVFGQAGSCIAAEILMMGEDAFLDKVRKEANQLPAKQRAVVQQHMAFTMISDKEKESEIHGRNKECAEVDQNDAESS